MARDIGGESGSIAMDATASDPFSDDLTFTGASPSSWGWLATHSVTVVIAADINVAAKCFCVQLSRGDLTRFFCSMNQLLVRLGR